ncbi:hypothetical protein CDL12_19023 [Handroanthus impetiginosus]|uniref:Cupin type-1 domain-containing protein n=1 Tax=Handroanthus impetiginosus TaxID=429701 RepID=A0A2G9GSY6_9LAMI|nr:hypothetical protein CDL12_19023 [Handroanthus impetiginosus]
MANLALLSLSLSFLFLFHGAIAQLELQQQHRLRAKTRCRIQKLTAREPSRRFESEAGVNEYWDTNSEEFECAGIEFVRHVIQPKGLLVPHYSNAPQLVYIVQGSGIHGAIFPGCAETYESEEEEEEQQQHGRRRFEEEEEERGGRRSDRHQKLRRIRRGDILALQEGITHWVYNDGDTPLIGVSILDVGSQANQLDLKYRRFFLAGNPGASQSQDQDEGGRGRESEGRKEREQEGSRGRSRRGEQEQEKRNIFFSFPDKLLADIFNIDEELARSLKAYEDNRGTIIRAERLNLNFPEWGNEEQERRREEEGERERQRTGGGGGGGRYNGLEETFCSLRIKQNIDHPAKADVYNPRGGRISTINSQNLPILSYLKLSAERGVLYRKAVFAPHWNMNAHSAIYVTGGSARIQVAGSHGNLVFDEEVKEGQLLIVPQNFVVLKQAGNEGFEWVSFKTNDNAMKSQLAGRLSVIRAIPEEVLMNVYGFSREDARRLKYSREEATVFSPSTRTGGGRA